MKCGKELKDRAIFCSECGARLPKLLGGVGKSDSSPIHVKESERHERGERKDRDERDERPKEHRAPAKVQRSRPKRPPNKVSDIFGIFTLDSSSVKRISELQGYFLSILMIVGAVIVIFLSNLAVERIRVNEAMGMIVITLIVTFVSLSILHGIASRMLGGKGTFKGLINLYGHFVVVPAFVIFVATLVNPILTNVAALFMVAWSLVVLGYILKHHYGFSTARAIGAVVLFIIVMFVITILIGGIIQELTRPKFVPPRMGMIQPVGYEQIPLEKLPR